MATSVLGLKTFTASDPVDYNEVNDNYVKIDGGVKTALQGRAAHNLLDNSWFAHFVNQRGGTSTAGTWNYCIDRWRAIGTAGQLVWHNSDHVALGALRGISQAIENKSRFVGKTYTLAAKDTDGVLFITSGTYGGDSNHIWKETNGMELRLYSVSDDNNIYFSLKNLSSDASKFIYLKWAALYEGAYTADTLPAYVPKGYAAELAECQMYLYDPIIGGSANSTYIGTGFKINDTTIYFTVPIPTMRKTINTPTLTAKNISIFENSGNVIVPSELYVLGKITDGVATICARTNSALSAGKVYTLFASADDSSLQFSNDL